MKFNCDEIPQLEVVLFGKTYVPKITTAKLTRIQKIAKESPNNPEALLRQLACLLEADYQEIKDLDLVKAGKICAFLLKEISSTSSEKPKQ